MFSTVKHSQNTKYNTDQIRSRPADGGKKFGDGSVGGHEVTAGLRRLQSDIIHQVRVINN